MLLGSCFWPNSTHNPKSRYILGCEVQKTFFLYFSKIERLSLYGTMGVWNKILPSMLFHYLDFSVIKKRSIDKKMMLREDDPPANQAEFYAPIW